jgi:hypothetical protein
MKQDFGASWLPFRIYGIRWYLVDYFALPSSVAGMDIWIGSASLVKLTL